MLPRRAFAWTVVPGATAVAIRQYRRTARRLDAAHARSPALGGTVHTIPTRWGRLSYRLSPGDPDLAPLVLIHGWGRTGDSAWWPIIERSRRTLVIPDLPGHGRSMLDGRFSFRLAADAVVLAVEHAGLTDAVAVGHSMGGPVAMTALAHAPAGLFSRFIAVATSAYWVTPRQQVKLAAAPWILSPRSPILIRAQHLESTRSPDHADRLAWEYAVRPPRSVLIDAALELRRFDATGWAQALLPPTVWVVADHDGVIDPRHQRRSAQETGSRMIVLPTDHSVVTEAPDLLNRVIEQGISQPEGPLLIAL
jgi:pimeloyl-ACP methyl ester carboxylesterase